MDTTEPEDALGEFLRRAGAQLCDAGDVISRITDRLQRVAAAQGAPDARIFVLPTGVFVRVPPGHTDVMQAYGHPPALDRILALKHLLDAMQTGRYTAAQANANSPPSHATRPVTDRS